MQVYHNTSKPLKIKALRNVTHKIYVEESLLLQEKIRRVIFGNREDQSDIYDWQQIKINVEISNVSEIDSFESFFEDDENILEIEFVKFQNKDIKNYSKMFKGCYRLKSVNMSSLSGGIVKQCSEMFYGCSNLEEIVGLEKLDMSKVKDISGMFQKCSNLSEIDGLQHWDLKNVKTCEELFCDCKKLTTIKNLDKFIQNQVENISGMFKNCSRLTKLNINGWDTSNVKDMSSCFEDCSDLKRIIGLEQLNLSNVKNLYRTFSNCKELINVEQTENWNLESVTNISYMFNNCLELKEFSCENWNSKKLKKIEGLFAGCNNLEHLSGLEHLDVKNVTSLENLFCDCERLTEIIGIANWNVEKIEDIDYLFYNCKKISSLDLSKWTIPHLKSAKEVFGGCENLQSLKLGKLDFSEINFKMSALEIFITLLSRLFISALFLGVAEIIVRTFFPQLPKVVNIIKYVLYCTVAGVIILSPWLASYFSPKKTKPNNLKYLSLLKTVLPTISGTLPEGIFIKIFGFSPENTKLVAINTSADNIPGLMYLTCDDVYFCCKHGEKEGVLKKFYNERWGETIIECDQEKVERFFEENINLPYEELKEKFEEEFVRNNENNPPQK